MKWIDSSAFYDCSALTSVTIPNSVTGIGDNAFWRCSALTSVTIPSSVTSIGEYAFAACSGLTSVTIPYSVIRIGKGAFTGCYSLDSIKVAPGNVTYDSRNNCNAIIEIKSNTLIAGCKNTVIPNSVTSIGPWALAACFGHTSVSIPNSVKSIGVCAFYGCSLTSVSIPNSVTSIGSWAFDGCDIPTVISLIENPFAIEGKTSDVRAFSLNTFDNATLYVPKGTIEKYRATEGWKDFENIVEGVPAGINDVIIEDEENVKFYFDINGRQIPTLQKGLNIVKKANGKTKKVIMK